MRLRLVILTLSAIALLAGAFLYLNSGGTEGQFRASVVDSLSSRDDADGFARALRVRRFTFPDDSGPHPEFQTEWWYYTGNLTDGGGRRFGFQLTFFRRALSPNAAERKSNWATNQVYFAHFALSDIGNGAFYPSERWSRGAMGLAGAEASPFRVWVDDWSANSEGEATRLRAGNNSAEIDLSLVPTKPTVLHGEQGLSRKSGEPGNASYYYSQTRLDAGGIITVNGERFGVRGLGWLDREWSTSSLGSGQSGWDWFALQLGDGRELMLYQLRLKGGGIDPFSSGSLIESDGTVRHLAVDNFQIEALDTWKSPKTGIVYPSRWKVSVPAHQISLTIIPHQPNQELTLTFTYWEGAVRVEGENISGNGYVELTGYAETNVVGLNYRRLQD